jgi:hypothetical protein
MGGGVVLWAQVMAVGIGTRCCSRGHGASPPDLNSGAGGAARSIGAKCLTQGRC